MSDALTLPAELRERAGKGASRELRRNGRVPAVIYGGKEEPTSIHIEERELLRQLNTGYFMNSIVMIEVDGEPQACSPGQVLIIPKGVSRATRSTSDASSTSASDGVSRGNSFISSRVVPTSQYQPARAHKLPGP